ncbi:MAG: hypothetical protein MI824_18400 [Hyphomicrobiales bacterium]|nr:hypothetical protein [Hyphomicrobiales bacterium]
MSAEPAAAGAEPAQQSVRAFYFVTADADPGLLPRLVEPFSKMGMVPHRVHASRESGDGAEVTVDLRVFGVTRQDAHLVDKMLQRVVGVRSVIALTE